MRDAFVGWEEGVVEGFSGVYACEVAGFGDGDEELLAGGGVDDEVVYGFVGGGAFAFVGGVGLVYVGGCGEHGEDGLGVGHGEGFALE